MAAEEKKLRSWADEARLDDPLIVGIFNKVIHLIEDIATLAERLPEGQMIKTESIPKIFFWTPR